ncbi:MAG: acetate kinase [archaeon]
MKILVLNSGSSSLKYKLIDMLDEKVLFSGHVDGMGLSRCLVKFDFKEKKGHKIINRHEEQKQAVQDHVDAVMLALKSLRSHGIIADYSDITAIGHRVVHGGENHSKPVLIDDDIVKSIKDLCELAPLHNPANLAGIMACRKMLPAIPQVAVFDTAFHQTMAPENYLYGMPLEFYRKYKIRKYGFHGPSHKYVSEQAAKLLRKNDARVITCHLGNGASITAIKGGKSVVTSMGFTPLEGLVMGTRSGSIDPAVPLYLCQYKGYSARGIDSILNKKSGLFGLSGVTPDVRDLHKMAVRGHKKAKLALDIFANRVAFYIGGYAALLNGVDAIVFTGGIGEHGWFMRKPICSYLTHMGVRIDEKANKRSDIIISSALSKIKVFVIPTNEELEIARETRAVLKR